MAIFDFRCGKCDNEYEQMLYKSDQKPKCPKCSATIKQNKQISFNGFIRTEDSDAPKNDAQLARYLGNGKYF